MESERSNANQGHHSLDWLNITQSKELYRIEDRRKRIGGLRDILERYFDFSMNIKKSESQVSIESQCRSVYAVVNSTQTQIQFRGAFFLYHQKHSWKIIESVYENLYYNFHQSDEVQARVDLIIEELGKEEAVKELRGKLVGDAEVDLRVTRVDIKRDYKGRNVFEVFPLKGDNQNIVKGDDNLYWSFKSSVTVHIDKKLNEVSGFTHSFFEGKLIIYNKVLENQKEKCLKKKKAFRDFYNIKDGDIISRVELRLDKKRRCVDFTEYLKNNAKMACIKKDSLEIINLALKRFSYKNRVYVVCDPAKSTRMWSIESRFLEFISIDGVFVREKPSKANIKIKKDYMKAIKRATAVIANQVYQKLDFENLELELTEDIREFVLNNIVSNFQKVKEDNRQHEKALEKTREALRRNETSRK